MLFWTIFGLMSGIFLLIVAYVCLCCCCSKELDIPENIPVQRPIRAAHVHMIDSSSCSTGRSAPRESSRMEHLETHEIKTNTGDSHVDNEQSNEVLETEV